MSRATSQQTSHEQSPVDWSAPFDELCVGQRFRTARRAVGETDLMVFSALTGDWHPQHSDPAWAARSPFGERIAHGMLTVSLAVGLVPLDPDRVVALRRLGDVVFKRPVHLEESIHVAGHIAALRPIDERTGLAGFAWAIRNDEDELVCRAKVDVVWRRDATTGTDAGERFWHEPITSELGPDSFVPVPL
jgi:3-hydroxybutyryl-CoA dehydratase